MRSRTAAGAACARGLLLAAVLLGTAGCLHAGERAPILPLPAAEGGINPGLGPGARPLSSGPGDKGSPSWSPGGERVAFIVDGYVVDRPVEGDDVRRWTTRDFAAEDVEWAGEESLAVLGGTGEDRSALYRATSDEETLRLREVMAGMLVVSPGPGEGDLIAAFETGPGESGIALLRGGAVERVYAGTVEGTVTGLSPAPDGRRISLAVRPPGSRQASELRVFGLDGDENRRVARLDEGVEILGAPQWTNRGIYFVAGSGSSYDLYRSGPGTPEPAPGVGEDFVAGGIRVSPDGATLAVIGRLNPKSPANLYMLNPETKYFSAVTTNEDMEIKTGPDDLAWSPEGTSIALIARGDYTEEPEVRAAPAENLLDDFYNLYEIPIGGPERRTGMLEEPE